MGYILEDDSYLLHVGQLERSGRFPWGSGEDPYQRLREFRGMVSRMRKEGLSNTEIASQLGFETRSEFDDYVSIYNHRLRRIEVERVENLRKKGWATKRIGEELGISEGKVRTLLEPSALRSANKFQNDVDYFKAQIDNKGIVDVSKGTESQVKITDTQKKRVLRELEDQGYIIHTIWEKQTNGNMTQLQVAAVPGTDPTDIWRKRGDIETLTGNTEDFDLSNPLGIHKPLAISPDRLGVKYGGEGGELEDGVIHIRPGVKDLSLRDSNYAQVRIQIGDGHFLKGMAVEKEGLPEGVDILFNTPKGRTDNKLDALKPLKRTRDGEVDYENPFGSVVDQIKETGPDGKVRVTSAMNIVNEEADWDSWSKNLASQFLSKQSTSLARSQLEMTRSNKQAELEEIMALENPVVKKFMLENFAESADGAAVHLKAAHLPRQKTHVILPINSLKDTEVFAPNFDNGERIALVRYPHGGTFEIPELVVNNRNKQGEEIIGLNNKVVLGINARVAEQLSGADFDGDTVVAIPNNSGRIRTGHPLKELENFDAKVEYGPPPGFDKSKDEAPFKLLEPKQVGREMGGISNLITDMDIKGASEEEKARAVKHSMVVIDAEKHSLDYKRSEKENRIKQLKEDYQGGANRGASTIVSRASARTDMDQRKPRPASEGGPIDPDTGEKVYVPTGRTWLRYPEGPDGKRDYSATPEKVPYRERSKKMADASDARTLMSDSPAPMEVLYAEHANEMKALGNKARLEITKTPRQERDPVAYKKYAAERQSLEVKLQAVQANAPRERAAQRLADKVYRIRLEDNPGMDKDEKRKVKTQAQENARVRVGSRKSELLVVPNEREWEAIQARAVSDSKLKEILRQGNTEEIVKLATPRKQRGISSSQLSRIKAMAANGYTQAEIAEQLGISTSTVNEHL